MCHRIGAWLLAGGTAAVLSLGVWLSPARATVMVRVPIAQLVQEADAVVRGHVQRVGPFLATEGGQLDARTAVILRVDAWLQGSGPGRIRLQERGGTFPDGSTLQVLGTPTYGVGQQVIVFLRRLGDGGWRTHQMTQGKFEVLPAVGAGEASARRDLSDVTMLDDSGRPRHGALEVMPLSQLLGVIQGSVDIDDAPGVLTR